MPTWLRSPHNSGACTTSEEISSSVDERVETALALAERLWLPDVLSQALNTSGLIALAKGRPETAVGLTRHALEVALEHDRPTAALRAYLNLGEALARRDRYEEALVHYDDGLTLARRVGDRVWERFLLVESCYPLLLIGRWDEADTRLAEVTLPELRGTQVLSYLWTFVELQTARGRVPGARAALAFGAQFATSADVQERCGYAGTHATVLVAEGRFDAGLAAAQQALEAVPMLSWSSQPAKAGLVAGVEAALGLGDVDRAEEFIALIDAEPAGAVPMYLRGHASRFRAKVLSALSQDEKAVPRLKSAAATFRELGLPFWTAVAELELGEWFAAHGREQEAAPLLSGRA